MQFSIPFSNILESKRYMARREVAVKCSDSRVLECPQGLRVILPPQSSGESGGSDDSGTDEDEGGGFGESWGRGLIPPLGMVGEGETSRSVMVRKCLADVFTRLMVPVDASWVPERIPSWSDGQARHRLPLLPEGVRR